MLALLLILMFSDSYLNTTHTEAYMPNQVPLNNRIWVKVSGNLVSDEILRLHDSLKCSDVYCSDKRPQVFSGSDIQRTKTLDSLFFSRICGSTFHLATLKDFEESHNLFRYIDLWRNAMRQGGPTSGNVIQVFWNEKTQDIRYYFSSYIGQLNTSFDLNNDTGFSVYRVTTKTDDPNWIIATPKWGTDATYNAVCVSDFLLDSSQVVRDTFRIVDTIKKTDTIQARIVDTVNIKIRDTIIVHDTISIQKVVRDTVRIEKWFIDTVYNTDTIRINDTVNISTCKDNIYSEILWKSTGTHNSSSITIQNNPSEQSSVQIKTTEKVKVDTYVYDNLGIFVSYKTFEIEDSSDGKYISFGGYADNGTRCSDGIYLIRLIVNGNGINKNTVYRIGLKD